MINKQSNGTEEKSISERVRERFTCDHAVTRLRIRGNSQYVMQCDTCGTATTSALAHASLSVEEKQNASPFDKDTQDRWWSARDDYFNSLRQLETEKRKAKQTAWFRQYNDFLRTPAWKSQRQRVLRRDGFICQACNSNPAIQVHHTSYKYHPNSPDFVLQSVCKACHDSLHDDKPADNYGELGY